MKKVCVLVLILGLLGACALQNVKTEASVFSGQDYSFDAMWKAAIQASVKLGYRVQNLEKESGILIFTKGKNIWTQNEPPQLTVMISEVAGNWQITAQYVQPGQLLDVWGTGKKAANQYIVEVYIILNK